MADRFRSTSKLFHTDGEWVKENAGKALVTSGAGKRIFMVNHCSAAFFFGSRQSFRVRYK